MITKRGPVRFPIRSRTTLGVPFGQHPALSTRRRQPLLAQKRSSNKPQLLCALTGGEYRQAAAVSSQVALPAALAFHATFVLPVRHGEPKDRVRKPVSR